MRNFGLAALMIATLAVGATGACGGGGGKGSTTPTDPASGDAFAAVFRAVEQWRQGWEVRSLEALAPLYRQDGNTVVVYQGRAHVGWPQAQNFLRQTVEGAKNVHLSLEEGQVTSIGVGGATYSARLLREVSDGVLTVTDEGFLTMTFARSAGGDRWEIVSEHYSYAPVP
ncbi:MAG TPA: nuclear transport factor 2 family protein [Kofleriaceae bacterium]|nr:nuclear transport factor 2 family protein [Kofleriaceae bacterium]